MSRETKRIKRGALDNTRKIKVAMYIVYTDKKRIWFLIQQIVHTLNFENNILKS